MNLVKCLSASAVLAFAAVGTAQAAAICSGCERIDGAAGTFLGVHNPMNTDVSTFQHTNMQQCCGEGVDVTDYYVWEISEPDDGSISADYTQFTQVDNFRAFIYADGGSVCNGGPGSACDSIVKGAVLKTPANDVDPSANRWEFIFQGIPAGRYILEVLGTTRIGGASAYGGQAAFVPFIPTPEPATLGLLGLGLVGFAAARRRRG